MLLLPATFCDICCIQTLNRLPRKAVDAPTLALFKARLDKDLSNVV